MKLEQIKEITERATEQLTAALNAGHSEALTGYLKAIARFHRYSLHFASGPVACGRILDPRARTGA